MSSRSCLCLLNAVFGIHTYLLPSHEQGKTTTKSFQTPQLCIGANKGGSAQLASTVRFYVREIWLYETRDEKFTVVDCIDVYRSRWLKEAYSIYISLS